MNNLSVKYLKKSGFKKSNHTDLILFKQLHEGLFLYLIKDEDDWTFKPLFIESRVDGKAKSLLEFKNFLKKEKICTLEQVITIVELKKILSLTYGELLNYLDVKIQAELVVLRGRIEENLKQQENV